MPKKLIAVAPRKAELLEYEEDPVGPRQILVRVEYASPKHGTELAAFRGESPHIHDYYDEEWQLFLPREHPIADPPFGEWNLGNQWVGVVTEVGPEVTEYQVGDRVCGYGGIRETHVVDAVNNPRLFKVPSNMSWQNALCFDPAQYALGGVRDAQIRPGDFVAVFGLGAIGLLAVQMAKLAGARYVAAVDPIEKRRRAAIRIGADEVLDPVSSDVGLQLKKATGKRGVDAVIETSGNELALQSALRGLAYGGTIAYVGWARAFRGAGLDLGREAHFNNARLIFSRACSEPNPDHPRWSWKRIEETCWEWLRDGKLRCEEIIDPVVPFEESAEAYEKFVDRSPEESVKLAVSFHS